jgi:hypothetical protein
MCEIINGNILLFFLLVTAIMYTLVAAALLAAIAYTGYHR